MKSSLLLSQHVIVNKPPSDKIHGGNEALQIYQEQLLLVERQRQNYNIPIMGRGQDAGIAEADLKSTAQIDLTKSDEERRIELRDYQMSLMNLNCRQRKGRSILSSHQHTASQATASISASDNERLDAVELRKPDAEFLKCKPATDLVASRNAEDASRDLDFDAAPSQDGKGIQDVLQDFDFDSFLGQDCMGTDSADYKRNYTGKEVKKVPGSQSSAARIKTQEHDVASIVPTESKLQPIAPGITHVDIEKPPLFVNPKQFHRIIVRRVARQNLITKIASQPSRPLRRHSYCKRRPRGPSGRFLTPEEILEQAEKKEEGKTQEVKRQPEKVSYLHPQKASDDRLKMMRKDGRASSRTQIWWVAYTSLHTSDLATYAFITSELESKIGVFESYNTDSVLCKWLSSKITASGISRNKPELKEIVVLINSIISVVVTIDKQLGLEIATVGWGCVYVCLALNEHNLSCQTLVSSTISAIEQCLTTLREVVDVIARYAVMENLCQHPSGALALKHEYNTDLIFLYTTILEYFSAFFSFEKDIANNGGDLQKSLKRCEKLAEKIRATDKAYQRFKVGVDMKAASESGSGQPDIEDMSDEGWVHVGIEEGRMGE